VSKACPKSVSSHVQSSLILHQIPYEKRNERNEKAEDTKSILAWIREKVGQGHTKRLHVDLRVEHDVEPAEKPEDKQCERERANDFHTIAL